ncbi:hypothetical protein CDD83_5945 [Cordyceps sp. RAO-2017]|nr:hypothetical protein CDD83_5945 [Cordyceps sp. RAO-2017]
MVALRFITGAILVGVLNGHAYASAIAPRDNQPAKATFDPALLDKYAKLLTDLNAGLDNTTKCYNDYVTTVQKNTLPPQKVVDSIDNCNNMDDYTSKLLQQARDTAENGKFPVETLGEKKLANVLVEGQYYSRPLVAKIKQQRQASVVAWEAYRVKEAARETVAAELAKPTKQQKVDVSKAVITRSKAPGEGGGVIWTVAGVSISGFAIAGVVTYAPFNEAAVIVADAIEEVEEAAHIASTQVDKALAKNVNDVTVGEVAETNRLFDFAQESLEDVDPHMETLQNHIQNVPEAERPDATAIFHHNNQQLNQLDQILETTSHRLEQLNAAVRQRLQNIL